MKDSIQKNIANQINNRVIPRWEWRTFGSEFPKAEKFLSSLPYNTIKESDEIYILSKNSNENCKIRNSLMDIKIIEQTNPDGLELWKPVLKASFPLSFEIVRLVLRTLHVRKPLAMRDHYTHHQFLNEIVASNPKLSLVDVKKKRRCYTLEGAEVELSELQVGNQTVKTIAVESEKPQNVQKVLKLLELNNLPNTNYIKALKKMKQH